MFVVMRDDILRPIPATPILAAIGMMTGLGSHGCARVFTGGDMAWKIGAFLFIPSSLQEVVSHRRTEQTDGQA